MPKASTDDKIDEIIEILHKMDKRDRLRTVGGFFRGVIGLIPILVLLGSVWYAYEYGDQLLEKISESAARQAAIVTKEVPSNLVDQLKDLVPQ